MDRIGIRTSEGQLASLMRSCCTSDATVGSMRTTIRLDAEVAAAAERLRRERHVGLGEAVNELARAGLARGAETRRFRQRTAKVGLTIDVTDVAQALELLDGPDTTISR